ncbi:putative IQ motif, EF-hand binding protein [Helianthus annuus]|nr:putative IQ motif, EF-hand binding protein [Helianthus annuus]
MGKKSSWLSAVKKALSPSESKEKKDKKSDKKSSKKYWFGKQRGLDQDFSQTETTLVNHVVISPPTETKLSEAENEQTKHAYSVAYATAVAAEAAVAEAHAAAEVVRLTSTARLPGISTEEIAAIKIQAAYRGHLARRAVRAVRGLGRLKSLIQGQSVKRQAISTLKCMQTLARVQSQVRSRRILMSEENRVLQQQILLKHEKELNNIRSSQMWKNSTKYPDPTFLDPNNPHWGWSWLERWMAAKPWETQIIPAKELSVGSEMGKRVSRPPSRQSPSTPPTRAPSSSLRVRPETPRGSVDGDSTSFYSVQSDRNRRQSRASSVCDNESLDSSPAVPSYMASTMSAKARSRMASPVHSPSPLGSGRKGSSEKGSMAGSAKKRLSFSGSPARNAKRFNEPLMMVSNS